MSKDLRDNYGRLLSLLEVYGPSIKAAEYVGFYFCEEIPEKKLKGALSSYAKGVKEETVIGLFDPTLFGSAKDGLLFTTAGVYFDETLCHKFHCNYVDIDEISITNYNEDCKDSDKIIAIKLKDGTVIENATSLAYNKTPLISFLKGAKQLAEEGYTAETDSIIGYISGDIPEEYKASCHKIIHSSALSSAAPAAGLAQLPFSDTVFITPIQIAMIIAIGKVFNMRISESGAKSIIAGASASLAGRGLSQLLIGWVPGYGNALNATTAFAATETIGWMAVDHFYKIKLEEETKSNKQCDFVARKASNETAKKFARILEENEDLRLAFWALGIYVADLDGISDEDTRSLNVVLQKIGDPNSVLTHHALRNKYEALYGKCPEFSEIRTKYLDKVETEFLKEFKEYVYEIIISNRVISKAEINFLQYEWNPYLESRGVDPKPEKDYGIENSIWQNESSEANDYEASSMQNSSVYSESVEVTQSSEQKEFADLLAKADNGDNTAMYNLGRVYEFGLLGKGKSLRSARNWYKKAVDCGNTEAVFRLEEVQKQLDFEAQKSKGKLKREDEYDDPSQLYNKGWHYENGDGVPKDIEYAKILYKTAASRGNSMAKARLNYLNSMS